jgi:transglutaminase-like putative cysteine protease
MENAKKYLRQTYLCESDSPEIIKLVKKIVKNRRNKEAVKALYLWVRDNVDWDILKIEGAKAVLKRKSYKALCADKTNLFIAFCRSVRIPSRYILLDCDLKPKRRDMPPRTRHICAEIFLNKKWIIADPGFGKLSKKIMPINKFGKPSWSRVYSMKRVEGLSFFYVLIGNLFIRFSKTSKILKKAIKESKE